MKKKLLFLLLSVLTLGAWADDVTAVVDNISSYSGTASYVYNKADKQVYVRNNMETYEPYGKYYGTDIEYIESTGREYINTGYIHKTNTRIVADVMFTAENGNWNAVFGSRKGGGPGATNGLVYFWRANGNNKGMYKRNTAENFGNDQSSAVGAVINQRYTIDANGNTVTLTKQGESSAYSTITCTGELSVGDNPLFIFDLSTGNGTPDNSRSKMKLYSFKIYEGDNLVRDYVPIRTANGEGGLYDKIYGTTITAAKGSLACGPITTYYNGKIIYDPTDKVAKKHNGSEFVSIGNMTPGASISATEYKNMKNWTSFPDWWTGVFNSGDNIQWDANTQTNTFNPYVGIGGWEPLYKTLDLDDGVYNVSFKYSGSEWTSHGSFTTLPFLIVKGSDVYQNFDGGYNADNIISYIDLPNTETNNVFYSQDFSAMGNVTLEVQFGVLKDNEEYWFKFADIDIKKYVFPENYPVVNFSYLINSLLEEVEAFDTNNTTVALATSLNTAVTAARNSLDDAEDLEGQFNAMEALQTAFDKANAIDAAILRKTVALAEEEGVPHDEADNVLSNAEATQENVNDALAALRLARKRHNAEKVTEEFVGTAPADGLECYLYNVGEKKFLCGGNNYGTHASLGFAAHFVTLHQVGEGYKIQTHLPNGTEGTNDFLGDNGYVDVTPGAVWQFVEIDGNYNIKLASDNTRLLGYESPTVNQISTNCKTTTGATNQWKLVTKAERDALLVNATPDNPVDATYYIDNPGFDQRWSISNWTLSDMAVNNRGQEKSDFVVSGWNESGDGNTAEDFKIEQVITGLMPGLYEVGVQACYRHGGDSEDDGESYAKLFANNEETIIKGVKAEINKIPQYTTLGTDEKAIEAFQTGLYKNKVRVAVGSDGELTIGVKRDAADFTPYDWLAADNFRLTYLGGYVELDEARLDYIENNIDEIGKQYYDTGYRPNEDTKVEVKFWANIDGGNDWQAIFSGRNSGNNQSKTGISMYVHGNKVGYFVGNLGGSGDDFADLTRGEVHTAIASLGSMVLDGVEKSTGQSTWNTTTNNITLFSNPTWDHSFRGRIYYCKIYEGDELRHYFVPILKDGVPYFHCEKCNDDIAPHEGATFTYSGINETANVIKLNRTLKAGRWNTFCVPFNMDKSKLGEGAEVKELSGATKNGDNYTMNFTDASTIEAGKPYMVKVASEINSIELVNEAGISVNTTTEPSVTKDGVTFHGVYASGKAPMNSFIISNNVFYLVDSDNVTLNAFRGYITVAVDGGAKVKALDFIFEDDATGISDLKDSNDLKDSKVIYNLAGQRLSKMQKGINIVNGKKIMVK